MDILLFTSHNSNLGVTLFYEVSDCSSGGFFIIYNNRRNIFFLGISVSKN